jgi:hypothetical protein
MSINLNKYLHGTLWGWMPSEFALIISSDEHNNHNSEIVCVSVSRTKGDSITIENIQCGQIHTIEKSALADSKGAVPVPVLSAVKAKIRVLFNMGENVENLQGIKETAAKLIGELAKIEQPSGVIYEVEAAPTPVIIKEAMPTSEIVPEGEAPQDGSSVPSPVNKQKKPAKKQRGRKSQKPEISERTGKPKREMRSYTDEDETFVLDENHTTEEIMDRFGYTEKRKVADLKFMLKKRREKRQAKESQ